MSSGRKHDSRERQITEEIERISNACKQDLETMSRKENDGQPEAEPSNGWKTKADELSSSRDSVPHASSKETDSDGLHASFENSQPRHVISGPSWDCSTDTSHCLQRWYLKSQTITTDAKYVKILGEEGSVALYVPDSAPSCELQDLDFEEILDASEGHRVDASALGRYLSNSSSEFWSSNYRCHLTSLEALHFAAKIYSTIPDASVDLSVISKPIHGYYWTVHAADRLRHVRSFSCIATFESGYLNIYLDTLKGVMGISTGNSLYMAQFLWSDPYRPPP